MYMLIYNIARNNIEFSLKYYKEITQQSKGHLHKSKQNKKACNPHLHNTNTMTACISVLNLLSFHHFEVVHLSAV